MPGTPLKDSVMPNKRLQARSVGKQPCWTEQWTASHECSGLPFITSELSVAGVKLRVLLTSEHVWIVGLTPGKIVRFHLQILAADHTCLFQTCGVAIGQTPLALGWHMEIGRAHV